MGGLGATFCSQSRICATSYASSATTTYLQLIIAQGDSFAGLQHKRRAAAGRCSQQKLCARHILNTQNMVLLAQTHILCVRLGMVQPCPDPPPRSWGSPTFPPSPSLQEVWPEAPVSPVLPWGGACAAPPPRRRRSCPATTPLAGEPTP